MSTKTDLHGTQSEKLKQIWLEQAKKFSGQAKDLRDFIQSAHRWSDLWHTTVRGMPNAEQQRGLLHPHASSTRISAHKQRRARAQQQNQKQKMSARFPGTAGHRQR